jgi:predicted dehydrogenase
MMENAYKRRRFLYHFGQAAVAAPYLDLISLDAVGSDYAASLQTGQGSHQTSQGKKLGVALVGLGKYSEEQLAPALQQTKLCKLTAIVTGTPKKAEKWKEKYGIADKNIYSYENFDRIKDNSDVDIVYVVLPNALHAPYTVRAAQAGKHVICEKPMAVSVEQCKQMIQACKDAKRLLSIGYRLQFEPHNMTMAEFGTRKTYGAVKKIIALDSQKMESGVWRLNKKLAGGGPLMDLGIYCVQGSLYVTGELPKSVTAKFGIKEDLEKFRDVEQAITFQLQFPSGAQAECRASYADVQNHLRAEAENGFFELSPAFAYEGLKARTSRGPLEIINVNQQAFQMDDFADCVLKNKQSKVSGEMGLRDVTILMAIYEAARSGEKVILKGLS